MWNVLVEYEIWRLKFNGSDPPAKVKPLRVTPKEGCVPYRCKGRKNNPLEERFLQLFAQELVEAGVINSRLGAAQSTCHEAGRTQVVENSRQMDRRRRVETF